MSSAALVRRSTQDKAEEVETKVAPKVLLEVADDDCAMWPLSSSRLFPSKNWKREGAGMVMAGCMTTCVPISSLFKYNDPEKRCEIVTQAAECIKMPALVQGVDWCPTIKSCFIKEACSLVEESSKVAKRMVAPKKTFEEVFFPLSRRLPLAKTVAKQKAAAKQKAVKKNLREFTTKSLPWVTGEGTQPTDAAVVDAYRRIPRELELDMYIWDMYGRTFGGGIDDGTNSHGHNSHDGTFHGGTTFQHLISTTATTPTKVEKTVAPENILESYLAKILEESTSLQNIPELADADLELWLGSLA